MSEFKLVPGAPAPHWQKNDFSWENHFFFSYSRHAMIEYLKFIKAKQKLTTLRLLSPQYMCHEVINSLKSLAEIYYFSQNNDFSFSLQNLEEQIIKNKINVLMISHLYGRYCASIKEISELCHKYQVILMEDSAHLPHFYLADKNQYSHVQFFTYRKLFSIPYGATCVVRPEEVHDFSVYYIKDIKKITEPQSIKNFGKTFIREQVKQLIIKSGIKWERSYTELGIDPLKDFNQLHPLFVYQLKNLKIDNYIENRRNNYLVLRDFFKEKLPAWSFLEFDLVTDVPYQFLISKNEKIPSIDTINKFLKSGISMVKGLELPPEIVSNLGENHSFNNQLAIPIHQDVNTDQLQHVVNVCANVLA